MVSVTIDRRDGLNSAAAIKGPCRVATTANITLTGLQTIDGVALAEGDRVLVKSQTDARDNGIRIASTGNWERSADFRNNRDIVTGTQVYITHGTLSGNRWYGLTSANPISVGTTSLTFALSDNLAAVDAAAATALADISAAGDAEQADLAAAGDAIIAEVEAARDTTVAAAAALPSISANTMLVDNAAGDARETKTFAEVRDLLDILHGFNADGATNDQAAFDLLEAARPGDIIDLRNKTYRVTTLPTKCRYWNGAFKVGGTIYPAQPFPWLDPMDGEMVVIDKMTTVSTFPAGLIWNAAEDELIAIEHIGTGHIMESSMIIIRRSQDGGDRWTGLKTIFSRETDSFIRSAAFAAMGGGRVGGIVTTGPDGSRKQWFVYTDDITATEQENLLGTWTTVEITASITNAPIPMVFGQMFRWPASAGGHDTNGWQVTAYVGSSGISVIRTKDNGANWEDAIVKGPAGLPAGNPQEATIVQTDDGWLMIVRTSANTNLFAATSTDFVTWSAWIDTGVPLGGNPAHAIVEGGNVNVYIVYREVFPGAVDENTIVCYQAPATEVLADPTVLGRRQGRIIYNAPERPIAMFQSVKSERGDWYHLLKVGEGDSTNDGSGASTALIRQRKGARMGFNTQTPIRQVIENPVFRTWPRGTSWSGITSDRGGPGRWRLLCSTSTVTAAQIDVPDSVRNALPVRSEHGLSFSNSGAATSVGLVQRWSNDDARSLIAELVERQRVTVRLFGWGSFPSVLWCGFTVNGSALQLAKFSRPQGIQGNGAWITEAIFRHGSLADEGISNIADVTRVEFYVYSANDSIEISTKIAGVFCFLGDTPLEPPLPTYADDLRMTNRYCEKIQLAANQPIGVGAVRAATATWLDVQYSEKMVTPSSITASPATDFHGRDSADYVASALTFSSAGKKSCRMVLTISGATTGRAQIVEVVGSPSADPHILVDTGY